MIRFLAAAFLTVASTSAHAADCTADAKAFLAHADTQHYTRIAGREECWKALYETDLRHHSLTRLIAQGNLPAARFVARSLVFTDGAMSEDAHIMLSESIDNHPAILLQLVHEGDLKPEPLHSVLSMEPERFVDREAAFEQEMQRRKHAIETVGIPSLATEKQLAIAYITGGPLPDKYRSQ